MNISKKIKKFFSEGHQRSLQAKKNIAFSFLLKAGSIFIGFLIIPLTIEYVSPAQYGIWLTLSSLIGWMNFFDIGLGNGLKNKLAAANALGEYGHARVLVSTTYALLIIISLVLFTVFYAVSGFIDWQKVLNTGTPYNYHRVAVLIFGLFCIQFVVQIINTILTACHLIAKVSLILLIGQLIGFAGVLLLLKFTQSSLLLLVIVNGGSPLLVLLLASFWYYHKDLKDYSPALRFVNFKNSGELLGSGAIFFVIQIGALVLFQTDNIVVIQLFGPAQVTIFNIAYKLFSVFIMGFNIIISPFWSAFTDAYTKGDLEWITSVMVKMKYVWLAVSAGAIVLFFVAPFIYRIWLGNRVTIPVLLSFSMVLYIIAYTWQTIHVYFLNGINKIRLQLLLVVAAALVNIPLAIFWGDSIGLAGVTLSNAFLFFIMGTVFYYQTKKILNREALGLLNA